MLKKILTGAIALTFIILMFSFFGCERVDAGSVGIKVNMTGGERGISKTEYVTGWVFYNKVASKVYEFPVSQQHIDYDETNIVTKGGFLATIKPSFNYSINSGNVADMFQNLRVPVKQMEQGWLKNAIIGSVTDVANTFSVDSIFNHRQEFETAIVAECNKRVSRWFTVSQLRTNIIPPKEISQSIINKTRAEQDRQAANAQREVKRAEAENDLVVARKDSTIQVMAAMAEAKAITVKQQALQQSPQYVDLIKAEKWNGVLPTYMLGGGSNTLFSIK